MASAEENEEESAVGYEAVEMVDVLEAAETAGHAADVDAQEDDPVDEKVGIVVDEGGPGGHVVGLGGADDAEGDPEAGQQEDNWEGDGEMGDILPVMGVDADMPVERGILSLGEAGMG